MERLVMVVWDGAAFAVTSELLKQGRLPNLAAVVRDGGIVPVDPASPNCQTPPCLADMFTSTPTSSHGITGFHVPLTGSEHSVLDFERALNSPVRPKTALLWDRAAEGDVEMTLAHLPWQPSSDNVRCLAAYNHPIAAPAISAGPREFVQDVGGRRLRIDCEKADATVFVDDDLCEQAAVSAVPRLLTVPIEPHVAACVFIWRSPDDDLLRIGHLGAWRTNTSGDSVSSTTKSGPLPFLGFALGDAYRSGLLGLSKEAGGSGAAESALIASLDYQAWTFGLAARRQILEFPGAAIHASYHPSIDEAQHERFRQYIATRSALDPVVAAYQLADRELGRILGCTNHGDVVVVCSDHGAEELVSEWYVNESFAKAGLLQFGDSGEVDLSRSTAVFHPARNGSIWINTEDRHGGVVPTADRTQMIGLVASVLSRVEGPSGPCQRILTRETLGNDAGLGDLFLVPKEGVDPRSERHPLHRETALARKGGSHLVQNSATSLQGIAAGRPFGRLHSLKLTEVLGAIAPYCESLKWLGFDA